MTNGPFDELDRLAARSLAAREEEAKRRGARPIWPWLISAGLLAFALGLIGSPVFERAARSHLPAELRSESVPAPDPRVGGLTERVERLEVLGARPASLPAQAPAADVTAVDSRIATLEMRMGEVLAAMNALAADQQRTSSALAMEDARLRDLFLLGVTRRMLEAGRPLTQLEPALEARYRATDSASLDALLAWSRSPQSRHSLQLRLQTLADVQAASPASQNWWDRLKARLGSLVTVRTEGGTKPLDFNAHIRNAREAMAAGDVTLAIAALRPLPQTADTRQWLGDAQLLLEADTALSRLEAAAINEAAAEAARRAAQSAPAQTVPGNTAPAGAAPQGRAAP